MNVTDRPTASPAPAAPVGRRLPAAVVVAWALALAILAGLGVAVWHYLDSSGGTGATAGMSGMTGMAGAHGTADSLTRAGGRPVGTLLGGHLLTAWQLDAVAAAVVVVAAAAYCTGLALLRSRAPGTRWPLVRTVSFLAGLAVVVLATCSSIAVYDQVLFTAHMLGHLALVMVAPALLVYGHPLTLALAVAPPRRRERLQRVVTGRVVSTLTAPPVALACYAVVIVGTHLTGVMDVVMRNTWAGQLEHLVFVLAGLQFFVLVVGREPIRWQLATPARWLLLAVAMAVDTFTGVVLLQGTHAIGMVPDPRVPVDALSDTHTGGAIMWFGGDGIMAVIMVALVVGWLLRVEPDRSDRTGWLEQARRATFAQRTAGDAALPTPDTGATATDFDDDDAARASYNAWLASIDERR